MRSTAKISTISRLCVPATIRHELDIDGGDVIEVTIRRLDSHGSATISPQVYSNGRFHVPVQVREALDIGEGDIVEIDVRNPVVAER